MASLGVFALLSVYCLIGLATPDWGMHTAPELLIAVVFLAMAMVPLGRILQPDEIGDLVVYLASHGARGMTGQAISHCGGQVMW